MDQELEKLARKVAVLTKLKFERDEGMHPLFYGVQDNGKRYIFDPIRQIGSLNSAPYESFEGRVIKNTISYMAQILFAAKKVKRYVYVSEAWALFSDFASSEDIEEAMRLGGAHTSSKRIEIIAYEAEDMEGHKIHGHQSIIRPSLGSPYLDDDLELKDSSQWDTVGLFTGLLDFRKYHEEQEKDRQNAEHLP